ncbi:MAG: hypothetical protein WCE54_02960 [Ignavibacteriaceae bacterium]
MFQKNKSSELKKDESLLDIPKGFNLEQNTPNPFSTRTTICFTIPRQCSVKLVVYSLLEEKVSVLFNGLLSEGKYNITWDGTDSESHRLKNGGYVYFLEAESFVASRRMTIIDE